MLPFLIAGELVKDKSLGSLTAESFRLRTQFEAVRETLLDPKFDERRRKPLAYWSMPNDRRLPLAFMDRVVASILETPFDELYSTPGIGDKKIRMLIELLNRAVHGDPLSAEIDQEAVASNPSMATILREALDTFNHRAVTEGEWAKWKVTVARHRLQQVPLGRLARALTEMTSVIWGTPLGYYLPYSLEELRHLKTHGDKRVRSILEVFYMVDLHLANVPAGGHISVRLDPMFVVDVESAFVEIIGQSQVPSERKVQQTIIRPIVEQLKNDIGDNGFELVRKRIGFDTEIRGVRDQSEELGLTRARVYQILEECAQAIQVRWPRGRLLLNDLMANLASRDGAERVVNQIQQLQTLLFPLRQQS